MLPAERSEQQESDLWGGVRARPVEVQTGSNSPLRRALSSQSPALPALPGCAPAAPSGPCRLLPAVRQPVANRASARGPLAASEQTRLRGQQGREALGDLVLDALLLRLHAGARTISCSLSRHSALSSCAEASTAVTVTARQRVCRRLLARLLPPNLGMSCPQNGACVCAHDCAGAPNIAIAMAVARERAGEAHSPCGPAWPLSPLRRAAASNGFQHPSKPAARAACGAG